MKNMLKKENLMPVIVLGVICLISAVLMAGINMLTEKKILEDEQKAISESLTQVMPGGEFAEIELGKDTPETVTAIYKDNVSGGHVVTLSKQGYASVIKITVGITAEQKVTEVIITSQQETHGKNITPLIDAISSAANANEVDSADIVTGATKTSGYIKSAVYDAFVALGYASAKAESEFDNGGITATTDDEVVAIAKELMAGNYEKTSAEGMPTTVKGVYKNSNGGYAIHIATRTEWRPLETEGVVTVNKSGEITGVKMLEWIVGYDKELLESAPECDEEFLNSFIGKHASSLNRVDLVTHATNTSNNFTDALTSAMEILYPTKVYTAVGIAVIVTAVLAVVGLIVFSSLKRKRGGKKSEKQ